MRQRILCLVMLALGASPAVAQSPSEWKTFTSAEGRFSVRVPGTPTEQAPPKSPNGSTPVTHTLVLPYKDAAYILSYTDFPASLMAGKDASTLLTAARNGGINNVKGRLITEKEITVSGYPARDILASVPLGTSQGTAHFYIILARDRLYSVLFVGSGESAGRPETDTFLKSFRLLTADLQGGWKQFISADGGFSVSMPGVPKESTNPVGNGVTVHQTVLDKGDLAYIVAENAIGGGSPDPEAIPGLLNKGRDSTVANLKGKLLEEKSISLSGAPGKSIRVSVPQTHGAALVRSYIFGDRYYQVMLIGAAKSLEKAEGDRYFGSFEITASKPDLTWKRFSSKEGRFSIEFPGEPKKESLKDNITKFTAQLSGNQYIVVYVDMPEAVTDPDQITKALDRFKDVEMKAVSGKETSQKRITLGDAPGIEVSLTIPKSNQAAAVYGTERFYLVGKRVYEIVLFTDKSSGQEAISAKYFDSFKPDAQ